MANVSSSNSQKALVPKLRFPGFEEEWHTVRLSDFTDRITRKNSQNESDLPLTISSKDGLVDQISYFNKTVASKDMSGYYLLLNGEFAYNKSYSVGFDFGSIKRLDRYPMGALSTLYICFSVKNYDSDFIKTYFDSLKWYKEIYMIAAEGARNHGLLNVPTEDFFATRHTLPTNLEEQKKIAAFMKLLERRIDVQRRLVEALKSYKRGLLAAVFDEDNCILTIDRASWKQCKIGDFLFPRILKQVPTPDAPLMAFTAEGGVCPKGDRYDRSFLVKDENKQYKRTELNDFIYSSNNLDVGSIGLNKYGSAVISDVYEIFTIKGADISFIAEAICRPQTIAKILKYRQGVIYGQYRIYAENFLEVDICLPPIKEQIKYSQLLTKLDDRIVRESTVLKDLSEIRLGLLQRLFI